MGNIIVNNGSKTLFIDFSYLQNVLFKDNLAQLYLIVEKLGIEGVNSFQEFQNILRNALCKSAFICLIDDKARTFSSKNTEKQVFDAIIRIEFNTDTQRKLPKNTFIGFFVNINPEEPYLTVVSIFQTRLKPVAQDFETIIEDCPIQIINYKGQIAPEELLRRGIINSETIGEINKLQSNFEAEKTRWLNYLDFSMDFLNLQRKNSLPYLNSKALEFIKIDKRDLTETIADKQMSFSEKSSSAYFELKFEGIIKNSRIKYEVVSAIMIEILCDQVEKLNRLKKMQELALVPFAMNKAFPPIYNLQKNIHEIFEFNFERTRETTEIVGINTYIAATAQSKTLQEYWKEKGEIIFGSTKELRYCETEFSKELQEWKVYGLLYEVNGELEPSLFNAPNNINKLNCGYLAYVGIGEDVLIDRCRQVLKRISEGNIKNPYLVNYLFNTKLIQLSDQSNEIEIADEEFYFSLNREQKDAVIKALNSKDIFMLQGPPGTGKTQVICEIIYQLSKMDRKILVSSQNHQAINNVITRLPFEPNINRVRLVNQLNLKSSEKNNFSPERVVYNYYKSIAKSIYDDTQVEETTIIEFNEIENKLEALLNANRGYHQSSTQLRTLNKQISDIDNEISSIKEQEIAQIRQKNELDDEIFNVENLITEFNDLEFKSAVHISENILKTYETEVQFLMDEFTLNNFDYKINKQDLFSEIKKLSNKVLFENHIFAGIVEAKKNIQKFKRNAEFELATQEEQRLNGLENLLLKETQLQDYLEILNKFKGALKILKTDLTYQLQKVAERKSTKENMAALEVRKNDLQVSRAKISEQTGATGQELRELIRFVNHKFDLQMQITDVDLENDIKNQLKKYNDKLQNSIRRKKEFKNLFESISDYAQTSYGITNNWEQEIPTNKFTNQMIQESKNTLVVS
ncbi:superfamily I DNA/RNA helicase [Spiroplasma clarkii]|uniref:AAA domain-containing protein n=1 Tax=Spiroplasma clarkii TaxID=2139 RepID=UPI000B5665C4|nr:AAA domain-containing protein [Spiroplasma clarkii]ARU92184.1 superfamily I DNA/RNA helicase [Spiroplasma clarkii]